VWSDAGARCRFNNPRMGASRKSANGTSSLSGAPGASGASGSRAVAIPDEEERIVDAE
jgi:hypothetical protein